MKEFDAEEYYDDLVRYVEGYRELTQRAEFVSQYLAKADDTMLYTVSEYKLNMIKVRLRKIKKTTKIKKLIMI